MAGPGFPRIVSLACHDLRTPLATINGFAKTLLRTAELEERDARFVNMIDEAAAQMAALLDLLGVAAQIAGGRYEPSLRDADTLELASSSDPRVAAEGRGESIETDAEVIRRSLESLAVAAARHGGIPVVTWTVAGRDLSLVPVTEEAGPVVTGESPREVGALIARMAIERLGGTLALDGETLRVRL